MESTISANQQYTINLPREIRDKILGEVLVYSYLEKGERPAAFQALSLVSKATRDEAREIFYGKQPFKWKLSIRYLEQSDSLLGRGPNMHHLTNTSRYSSFDIGMWHLTTLSRNDMRLLPRVSINLQNFHLASPAERDALNQMIQVLKAFMSPENGGSLKELDWHWNLEKEHRYDDRFQGMANTMCHWAREVFLRTQALKINQRLLTNHLNEEHAE